MDYYSSNESSDSDYDPTVPHYSKQKQKKKEPVEMFVPVLGSRVSTYRTMMCKYPDACRNGKRCIYAHNAKELRNNSDPMPRHVVDIYKTLMKEKKQNPKNPYEQEQKKGKKSSKFIFNEDDYDNYSTGSTKDGYGRGYHQRNFRKQHAMDTQSTGVPSHFPNPLTGNTTLETAFCNLQIEKIEFEARYKVLEKQNEELKGRYEESEVEVHKLQTDNNSLRTQLKSLDQKIIELKEKSQKPSKSSTGGNEAGALAIAKHAIEALEEITRSPLTKKLMVNPVMTPSLNIVEQSDVVKILEKMDDHPFLKKAFPSKHKPYMPFKGLVNLRIHLKKMFDKYNSSASKPEEPESAREKGLKQQLEDRLKQVKRLEQIVADLEKDNTNLMKKLDKQDKPDADAKSKAVIQDLQNQIKMIRGANEDYKKKIKEMNAKLNEGSSVDPSLQKEKFKEMVAHTDKLSNENTKLNKAIKAAQSELAKSTKRVDKLKKKVENQKTNATSVSHQNSQLKKMIEMLEKEKIDKSSAGSQPQTDGSNPQTKVKYLEFFKLKEDFSGLLDALKELMECPILLVQMEDPCITYSGHTVDGSAMQNYIDDKLRDPWDESIICDRRIRNLLASKLQTLLDKYGDIDKDKSVNSNEISDSEEDEDNQAEFLKNESDSDY